MIGKILKYIANELNVFVCTKQGISPDFQKVILSSIMSPDGSLASREENVILMTYVDAQKDTLQTTYQQAYSQNGNYKGVELRTSPLRLNLQVLFSAYSPNEYYQQSLDNLTYVFQFFQDSTIMDRQNSPNLPDHVERLEFHMENLSFHDRSHLWGVMGSKYLPSVLYHVRLLTIEGKGPEGFLPYVRTTNT